MHSGAWVLHAVALLAVVEGVDAAKPDHTYLVTLPQRDRRAHPADGASVCPSADGRYAAFVSRAPLVDADTNLADDIYVLDTVTDEVTMETLTTEHHASNGDSSSPRLDGSGRYLVFTSMATNLVSEVLAPGTTHVFLRDRVERTTRLVSVDRHGRPANDSSWQAVISQDGRSIAFESAATTLVPGEDRNGLRPDVYLLRLPRGVIQRIGVTSGGEQLGSDMGLAPSLSGDGRLVAFTSSAELGCPRQEGCAASRRTGADRLDVYVHDTETRRTVRLSQPANGRQPDGRSFHPAISADGRFVAFTSAASNLVGKDSNRTEDVFVADLERGSIELVSRTPRGRPGNGKSIHPVLSADGALIAFQSEASDLVCASRCGSQVRDINMVPDVFLHDRRSGTTMRASADDGDEWMEASRGPVLAAGGHMLAFSSMHPVDGNDDGADWDGYLIRLAGDEITPSLRPKNGPRTRHPALGLVHRDIESENIVLRPNRLVTVGGS